MPQSIVYLSEDQDEKIKEICKEKAKNKADVIVDLINKGLEK